MFLVTIVGTKSHQRTTSLLNKIKLIEIIKFNKYRGVRGFHPNYPYPSNDSSYKLLIGCRGHMKRCRGP
jgi:hypothetical protein